jgi:hypothetical protein
MHRSRVGFRRQPRKKLKLRVSDLLGQSAETDSRMPEFTMAEADSVTTIVVGDCLPWPEDRSLAHERGPLDQSAIFHEGVRRDCTIRKISALGATVESDLVPALGERVAVELATGQRVAGKIAWTGHGELGVRFDDHVDIIALLNRKLVSQTRERRTMPRLEVRCLAHVKCGGNFWPAMLRNVSTRGLQLEGDELPAIGSYLNVVIEGLNVPAGEVVWRHGSLAGVELLDELSWTSIIPWVRGIVRKQPQP